MSFSKIGHVCAFFFVFYLLLMSDDYCGERAANVSLPRYFVLVH